MATYARVINSGTAANGRPTAIQTTSTTFHTAHATAIDEIYMWICNVSTATIAVTVEFGGTAAGDLVPKSLSIPPNSPPIPILTGQCLTGSLVCSAKLTTGSSGDANMFGYVNRIA